MPNPLVSFILPMYNGVKTIEETIRSLQSQTVSDWEAVIVNDGSTDGGPALVESLASADPRLRLIHRENGGRAKARNTGLDVAAGEYIYLMDADDLLLPHALADLLDAARQSPSRAAAGQISYIGPDGTPFDYPAGPSYATDEVTLDDWLNLQGFQLIAHLIHRDTLGATRKRETVPINEDLDLFLILATQGVTWRFVHKPLACYRLHPVQRDLDQYRWYATLWNDAFDRARTREQGTYAFTLDLSPQRQQRTIARAAWQFAQMMIVQDQTPRKDEMARIIKSESPTVLPIDPIEAGINAYTLTPMAEWRPLSAWRTEARRYLSHLTRWWQRCVEEGWAEPNFVARACDALIEKLAGFNHESVARAMAQQVQPGEPVVLAGLGQNGVLVARELQSQGTEFWVRDDGLDRAAAAARLPGARWLEPTAPLPQRATVLMSVAQDDRFLPSFAAARRIIRWADLAPRVRDKAIAPYRALLDTAQLSSAA